MFKLLGLLILGSSLYLLNPTLDQFEVKVKETITKDEGFLRSGWNALATVTGINAVASVIGAGSYDLCRVNLYVGSLYSIRAGTSEKSPLVGIGAGTLGQIVVRKLNAKSEENSLLSSILSSAFNLFPSPECDTIHKRGAFTS